MAILQKGLILYDFFALIGFLIRGVHRVGKVKIAIFATLLSIGLHSYLSWNYYPLKFAQASGDSLCNFNELFNCDAVAASSFSTLLGIPLAVWGATTNLALLLLLLTYGLRLTDHMERYLRYAFYLSLFVGATSVVMGSISLFALGTHCLFCILAYVFSFITLWALWTLQTHPFAHVIGDLKSLWSEGKPFLFILAFIPILSLVVHRGVHADYGAQKIEDVVRSAIHEWQLNPQRGLDQSPSLAIGPARDQATMTISEFADFLCVHCAHAYPSLHAFASSHKDVRFEFYSFALDGECNSVVNMKSGLPCFLAKATFCANKQDKGWLVHDTIFKNQKAFYGAGSVEKGEKLLQELLKKKNIDFSALNSCVGSDEAQQAMLNQGKIGAESGVEGTPTVFVNQKKLPRGQLIPVLKAAYEKSLQKK